VARTTSPRTTQPGSPDQKWLHDYLVNVTGRPTNFDVAGRAFPASVKSYAMAPKHMARQARRKEQLAAEAEAHGHVETAHELYWDALRDFHQAQHSIHRDTPQKRHYYERLVACYDKVIQHNPHEIRRVEIPWDGNSVQCIYHPIPGKPKAPAVLCLSGIDVAKELYVEPLDNPFHRRGFHVIVMDGPGMGIGRLRGMTLRADNYELAARPVLDFLLAQPEVDPDGLAVLGAMPGAYWATRIAASDDRVRALATNGGLYAATKPIFEDLVSPRFKWHVMYMMGIDDEEEFFRAVGDLTPVGLGPAIRCPALMVINEYDEFIDLEQACAHFDSLAGAKEMWLLEDEGHRGASPAGFAGNSQIHSMLDWLRDTLKNGRALDYTRVVRIGRNAPGPYGKASAYPFGEDFWY